MSTGKVVRNAGSHRILYALSFGARTSKDLKNVVGAINSVSRFDGEYMARLVDGGFVERDPYGWRLTEMGWYKLGQLGPAKGYMPKGKEEPTTYRDRPPYDPKTNQPFLRPGAEDHLKCPSRMGNRLVFRDGTVKEISDGH